MIVSDGITDAENAEGDMFGEERLERACQSDDAFKMIMEQVTRFRDSTDQNDDTTLIEIVFTG